MNIHHHHKKYIHHEMNADQNSFKGKLMNSLREVMFGLQDGIVSTLGAITGIAAGTQNGSIVILSGCVVIVVESISMAAGTFISSKSEREVQQKMLQEEAEEIELHPEAERQELVVFYTERGFAPDEIEILVNRITSNKELWLEEMAYKELGVIPGEEGAPAKDAFVMGLSYVIGGLVSLSSYFFLPIHVAVPVSIVLSFIALFVVGFIKGKLVHVAKFRSGVEMVVISLVAAVMGYIVGRLFGTGL